MFNIGGLYSYYSMVNEECVNGDVNGDNELKKDIERMNGECDELLGFFPNNVEINTTGELSGAMVANNGTIVSELFMNVPFIVLEIAEDDEFGEIIEAMQTHNGNTVIGSVYYKKIHENKPFFKRRIYRLM